MRSCVRAHVTGAGRERVCCSVVRWIATGTSTAEDVIAGSVNSGLFCERVLAVKPTALASQISVHVHAICARYFSACAACWTHSCDSRLHGTVLAFRDGVRPRCAPSAVYPCMVGMCMCHVNVAVGAAHVATRAHACLQPGYTSRRTALSCTCLDLAKKCRWGSAVEDRDRR